MLQNLDQKIDEDFTSLSNFNDMASAVLKQEAFSIILLIKWEISLSMIL
jgi:hypothetical protein